MRKELRKLSLAKLAEIAKLFSIYSPDKEELVDALADYFAGYRITWQDVKHRYQLNGETE